MVLLVTIDYPSAGYHRGELQVVGEGPGEPESGFRSRHSLRAIAPNGVTLDQPTL